MMNAEKWQGYTTICRLCMQRDGFMLGIFNHIQGKDRSIYKKIMDCTALEISSGDGLPNSICHRCLYKIEFCLEFRQQCFVSDATFRQINGLSKEVLTQTPFVQAQPKPAEPEENSVVMVVDPNALDYESECESETTANVNGMQAMPPAPASDAEMEPADPTDHYEFKNVCMCMYCDRAFSDKTECNRHEADEHDTDEPYKCSVCEATFADRGQFSSHLKSEHQNDKPYTCPECDRAFARRSDLRKHTIVHTGIKPFTCPICFKSFSRNTNLSKHMRIHKGQTPYVCMRCPRAFGSKLELTRHTVQHTGAKPFKCEFCHMSFMRKDKLKRHQKRHLPVTNMKDAAQELQVMRENLMNEYGVSMQDSNDNHIENMKSELKEVDQTEATNVAGNAETDAENMVIAIDPFTNDNEQENEHNAINDNDIDNDDDYPDPLPLSIEPEICLNHSTESDRSPRENADRDGYYSDPPDLTDSMVIDEPRFHCSLCGRSFMTAESLQAHTAMHLQNGERPFVCETCGKAFVRKRELDRHMTTHSGIKQFQCTVCEKRFSRKDKLLRHTRIHEVNKESCLVCGISFSRKDGLAAHMKTHVKEEAETPDAPETPEIA